MTFVLYTGFINSYGSHCCKADNRNKLIVFFKKKQNKRNINLVAQPSKITVRWYLSLLSHSCWNFGICGPLFNQKYQTTSFTPLSCPSPFPNSPPSQRIKTVMLYIPKSTWNISIKTNKKVPQNYLQITSKSTFLLI